MVMIHYENCFHIFFIIIIWTVTICSLPLREYDGSSFASLYAFNSVDCIIIGSTVVVKLCRPLRDDPLKARLIVALGYGNPFGPRQFVGSFNASPDIYLSLLPPLHFSVVKFGHNDSALVVKILMKRLIAAINCKNKMKL